MPSIRMLHIGKTGGSALKAIFKSKAEELEARGFDVKGRSHSVDMKTLKRSGCDGIIVFVRHPVSRFVSAFNSRLRQGQPRYDSPWSRPEEIAFGLFKEPNALAEALSSDQPSLSAAAKLSMLTINHVSDLMRKWLVSPKFLESNRSLLFYVGAQETMDQDVVSLFEKMGVAPPDKDLDEVARHETPAGYSKELSAEAFRNLTEWYGKDVELYEWCMTNRADINAGRDGGKPAA